MHDVDGLVYVVCVSYDDFQEMSVTVFFPMKSTYCLLQSKKKERTHSIELLLIWHAGIILNGNFTLF